MLGKHRTLPAVSVATATVPRSTSAETYTLHFKIAHSLILIEAVINQQPAKLIFDTGSTRTILSAEILGIDPITIGGRQRQQFPYGVESDHPIERRVNFVLDRLELTGTLVLAADLAEVSRRLGTRCNGILGHDVISSFSSVRIDYQKTLLQLER